MQTCWASPAPFLLRLALMVALEQAAPGGSLGIYRRDGGAGCGKRVLRPHGGRRFTGRNGLLAELEVGRHVISARNLAYFQSDAMPAGIIQSS